MASSDLEVVLKALKNWK